MNTVKLDSIIKALKGQTGTVVVGVLGSKDLRKNNMSNATIGLKHEMGMDGMPVRSFLRVPIADRFEKELVKSGAIGEEEMKNLIKTGDFKVWLNKIAIVAEDIVLGAFDSNGYGKWPAWAPGYENNTGMILVDTQQLRNSIKSEVRG